MPSWKGAVVVAVTTTVVVVLIFLGTNAFHFFLGDALAPLARPLARGAELGIVVFGLLGLGLSANTIRALVAPVLALAVHLLAFLEHLSVLASLDARSLNLLLAWAASVPRFPGQALAVGVRHVILFTRANPGQVVDAEALARAPPAPVLLCARAAAQKGVAVYPRLAGSVFFLGFGLAPPHFFGLVHAFLLLAHPGVERRRGRAWASAVLCNG